MNWVEQTLADFGKRMGIDGLALNAQGTVALQLQSGAELVVESLEDDVLVYQVHPVPFPSVEWRINALRTADFRHGLPFASQLGMRGKGQDAALVTLVRIPSRAFTTPVLEQVAETFQTRWNELV